MLLFFGLSLIPSFLGLALLLKKAGRPIWMGFVPVLNLLEVLKIAKRPWYWFFYLMIPLIGWIIGIGVMREFLRAYGKNTAVDLVLGMLVPFLYLPYLGFSKDVKYVEIPEYAVSPGQKGKGTVQEWSEAIGFAVIAATLIRWLIMEAYTIPTGSMENSLLIGDFLFVSKFHYGTRTPQTPLQVPLTHQKIWFTEIPSYSDEIQLPSFRLPGISSVKREDVVVFNVPGIEENNSPNTPRSEWIDYPTDLKTNFIKRCVAIPGDVLEIKDKQLVINGTPLANPPKMRFSYQVLTKEQINPKNLLKLELDPEDGGFAGQIGPNKVEYVFQLDTAKANELRKLPYVLSVTEFPAEQGRNPNIFGAPAPWNQDNFGPLTIPKKGWTIQLNDTTLNLYGETIRRYDHNKDVKIENGKLIIDGQEQTSYTFKQDYFFMMGDNRHNSADSRFWGFVPEDHIVGKAFFIWLSLDKYESFMNKIRWSRFFNLVR